MVGGGTGVFRTLFPPYTKEALGIGQGEIGLLLSVAAGVALASTLPAGLATDRLGRKRTLMVGMVTTASAVYVMAAGGTLVFAAVAVVMFGLSEAFAWGTMQVYAMDLSPENKRGAFLGVWGFFQSLGQIAGPLLIGILADGYGFRPAFTVATGMLVVGALMVLIFGPETRRRAR
jgi:MFS family permease